MNVKDLPEIALNFDAELRKWCLERAFETRELSGVSHMEVTNVAEEYYLWITDGYSQSSRQREYPSIPANGLPDNIEATGESASEKT